MKKVYTLLLALVISVAAVAQNTATVKKFADGAAPTMDGTIDDIWNSVEQLDVEFNNSDAQVGEIWIKLGWDDEALYLLAYIEDTQFCDKNCGNGEEWEVDRIEAFFNVGEVPTEEAAGAQQGNDAGSGDFLGYHQIVSHFTDPETSESRDEWTGQGTAWPSALLTEEGYTIQGGLIIYEFKVPFDSLYVGEAEEDRVGFDAVPGASMGFEFVYYDLDEEGGNRGHMTWAAEGTDGWADMGGVGEEVSPIGTITLSADVVSAQALTASKEVLSVFPNPATSEIEVKVAATTDVSIFDVTGRIVATERVSPGERMDVSNLNSGLYFVRAGNYSGKFIKK